MSSSLKTHLVRNGDTLSHIARQHGVSVQSILSEKSNAHLTTPNSGRYARDKAGNRIYVGDTVYIPKFKKSPKIKTSLAYDQAIDYFKGINGDFKANPSRTTKDLYYSSNLPVTYEELRLLRCSSEAENKNLDKVLEEALQEIAPHKSGEQTVASK